MRSIAIIAAWVGIWPGIVFCVVTRACCCFIRHIWIVLWQAIWTVRCILLRIILGGAMSLVHHMSAYLDSISIASLEIKVTDFAKCITLHNLDIFVQDKRLLVISLPRFVYWDPVPVVHLQSSIRSWLQSVSCLVPIPAATQTPAAIHPWPRFICGSDPSLATLHLQL